MASDGPRPAADAPVHVVRHGPVATVWLNRPEKRNAMTYAMWHDLGEACAELADDHAVRVVVVRGAGGHFCAGADITDLHSPRPAGAPSFMEVNMAAETTLASLPKPTVAFVEGDCVGGGCAIAIDCDLRLAMPSARFGITPARLGIVYPAPSIERVVALVGPAAAKQLLYTGDLIDSERAVRIGLVDEVLDADRAEARLAELCAHLASRSMLTQAAAKEMVHAAVTAGAVPADMIARWSAQAAASDDAREGAAAFAERRAPRFTWAGPVVDVP